MTSRRREAWGRFFFANVGGFLALAAVLMKAGAFEEKIASISAQGIEVRTTVNAIQQTTATIQTDVAVLKARVDTVENATKGNGRVN